MAEVMGIDVSKHQGTGIDWKKVKADGVKFAIIRAGYGKYLKQEDPCFDENIQGAYNAGINVGVFWYSYASTAADAEKEADVCLQIIKPYQALISLPVFFDQEYEPDILKATTRVRTDCCLAFIKKIQAAGYKAGVYASYDWFMNKLYRAELLDWPAWVAQYASKCQYTDKNLYIWQHTSTAKISGIVGNVDQDVGYFDLTPENGWYREDGDWYWYENRVPVKSVWRKVKGANGTFWYYLGKDGVMLKGMQKVNGKIYFFNERAALGIPEGAMILTSKDGDVQTKA